MHDGGLTEADRRAISQAILVEDTLEMLTVGIDIGSSTSQLLFARVFFERQGHRLSSRFVAVDRRVEWRSPILLTAFLPDGTNKLSHFVQHCYADAGYVEAMSTAAQ